MDPQVWIERHLQIADVGFAAVDSTPLAAPLDEIGIVRHPGMERVSAWLRRSLVSGDSLWHRRGDYRTTRYPTSHTPADDILADVDMDVLLFLTAKRSNIRLLEGHSSHSLASWIRLHRLTSLQWYSTQSAILNWALGPDGIMVTAPPLEKITYLLRSLLMVIRWHHPKQVYGWPLARP